MAIEGLSRQNIRQAIGRNLMGAAYIVSTTTTVGADALSIIDTNLFGGNDVYNGWWVYVPAAGTNAGESSRVYDTIIDTPVSGDRQLDVRPSFTTTVPLAMPYELWKPEFNPVFANEAINLAINSVTGRYYTRADSLALHADGYSTRFTIPSTFDMIDRVLYRTRVDGEELESCDTAWAESVDADFTITADTEHHKRGNASCKFVIAGTVSDGDFSSVAISSKNLSAKTHVEMWVYATTALAAADLAMLMDDTASCASPVETITFPAVAARTWTHVRLALANPELDTAIISLGLEYNANSAANTIWIDDIQAVNEANSVYSPLHKNLWGLNRAQQEIMLSDAGRQAAGYSLLKLEGGTNPAQLSLDATTSTLDEDFVIAQATATMLRGGSMSTAADNMGYRTLSDRWQLIADRVRRRFDALVNVRRAS